MKKLFALILALAFCACAAVAETESAPILPTDTPLMYGATALPVSVYSDGATNYVPLEALMQALGGTYVLENGSIIITISPNALPIAIALNEQVSDIPAVSWAYLNYWSIDNTGYDTLQEFIADCFYDDLEAQQNAIDLIDAAIAGTDDVDAFIDAVGSFVFSGGGVTEPLQKLAK